MLGLPSRSALLLLPATAICSLPLWIRSGAPEPQPPAAPTFGEILAVHAPTLTDYKAEGVSTRANGVRPLALQRGTGMEGSIRAAAGYPIAFGGSRTQRTWSGKTTLNGVDLRTGSFVASDRDISLPGEGITVPVSRTYNGQQSDGSARFDSAGLQGNNWFQGSLPEIQLWEHASDDALDMVYLNYGADRFVEFKRTGASDDEFQGKQGTGGYFVYTEDTGTGPDLYVYTDTNGTAWTFFGEDADSGNAAGQLWKVTDAAGNTTYVHSSSDAEDSADNGYDSTAKGPLKVYDAEDRRYTYTYTSGMLTEVKVETKTGGTWAGTPTGVETVAEVDYTYLSSAGTHGQVDDLQLVTKTTPLSDGSLTSTQYYRYWRDSDSEGVDHLVKLILSPEGWRRFEGSDGNFADNDYLTASDNDLKPYASHYFEYDGSGRVSRAVFGGDCGCGGGGIGEYNFTYTTNSSYSDGSGYDTAWMSRTVVEQPDGTFLTQYFDEVGQPLSQVITDGDPSSGSPDTWVTEVERNSGGIVTSVHTPANITGYTHANGSVAFTRSSTEGLIYTYAINSSGGLRGFVEDKKWKEGTGGSAYLLESYTYTSAMLSGASGESVHPLIASVRRYPDAITSGTTGSTLTSFTYSYHSSSVMVETVTQTNPVVTTGKNGSNSATVSYRYLDGQGRAIWAKSEDGAISYSEYANGVMTKQIRDADTTQNGAGQDFNGVTVPSSPVSFASSGSPLHQKTTYTHDSQGRRETATLPTGRVTGSYWSQTEDRMVVSLSYPRVVSGSPTTYYGPVSVRVTNQAGKTEASGQIELTGNSSTATQSTHVDTAEPSEELDEVVADLGGLCRLSTTQYDESGSLAESTRLYHLIPGTLTSAVEGANFDTTSHAYDSMGRKIRTLEPSGTIRRMVYDARGRVASNWIGTDDTGLAGGMTGGTENMVRTNALEYDGGSDGGNGHVTKRTAYVVDGTTNQRITNFTYDARGRLLLQENPQAPHSFHSYDNLGRHLATAQYSSVGGILAQTEDPVTETGNRLALSRSYYDEMGRVYKATRHNIDAADGSDEGNLESLTWYDEEGHVIKTEGSTLSKTRYDGLGRATHRFTLAVDNDSGYSDADDVSGDIVLQEDQTVYDGASNLVLMRVRIDRHHDDYSTVPANETTGELDTNADGDDLLVTAANLEGRAQITGYWYDSQDRMEDTVRFGTYDDSNFDRDGMTVPARSANALRTTNAYAIDGTVEDVTDPLDNDRRTEYDDAGRVIKTIRNYVDGTPSGDTDATVVYAYTDGLRVSITADMPAGQDDQVSNYTYGTAGGGSTGNSDIATGHLLQEVKYPDSASGTDVVTFAYNAQGQQIYKKDQAGNVIETVYDTAGRATERQVATLASGFDGDVMLIETAYDDLGRRESVTQYDAVSSGTATDGVAFTYGGWGQLTEYEEDRNGAVSSGGDEYDIAYTWETATGGRNTLRRNETTLPSGAVMDYDYRNAGGRHDADMSRVTSIDLGIRLVVSYAYNGVGQVVEMDYPEPDARSRRYGSTSGDYEDWDRFNRITSDDWTAYSGTATNFYDIDIAYDENSNITRIEDNVHDGFDVVYSMDELDRLMRAEEGEYSSGSGTITTTSRDQEWVLDQVGNWDEDKLDLDGDGFYTGTDEHHDDRTHNKVNELTARDTDDDGTNDFTLVYDAAGNLTDDGEEYKYEYDAFYRLRLVKDQSNNVVAEHRYNGLGHRIGEHVDTDDDGDVDGSDEWRHFAYDERWRIVAHFLGSDTAPTEEFVHHAAGLDGRGGSSYIDLVALRERDTDDNGSREERMYYCQNWRADVSAIIDSNGEMYEWVKYSAYGVPFGLPGADTDSDGDCDAADITQINTWDTSGPYDVRGDVNLDGSITSVDESLAQNSLNGAVGGRGVMSIIGVRHGLHGFGSWGPLGGAYGLRSSQISTGLGVSLGRPLDRLSYAATESLHLVVGAASNQGASSDASASGVLVDSPGRGDDFADASGSVAEHVCLGADPTFDSPPKSCPGLPGRQFKIVKEVSAPIVPDFPGHCPGFCEWAPRDARFKMYMSKDGGATWHKDIKRQDPESYDYWHASGGPGWRFPHGTGHPTMPNGSSNPSVRLPSISAHCSLGSANCSSHKIFVYRIGSPTCVISAEFQFCCLPCGAGGGLYY